MSQNNTTATLYDKNLAEAFAERIAGTIDAGAVALMISLGHKTRLFDIMAMLAPSSSQTIADAAGLDERYVREWLAVMVTGGVVTYDSVNLTYVLPREHAACLTRKASLGNYAVAAQALALMGAVEPRLLDCFASGEGTAYRDYPCFHEMMAEDSGQTVVERLFDTVLPLAPELTTRLAEGIDVLDAGCGRGQALLALAAHFPKSRFTGYDLGEDAIATARDAAGELENLTFAMRDLSDFDERERYDLITSFDAVHDQKDPQVLLRSLHRALRPDGVYLMQDIAGSAQLENNLDFPMASYLYAVSCSHCMPVSLGQGGKGLGTMWGWETAEAMLRVAGFAAPERHLLPHDPMNVWFVARKA